MGIVTRQAAVGVNGHIKDYEIWTGTDANSLTKQTEGTLTYSLDEEWINLPQQVDAQYVKVVIKSAQNGRKFACCAEFRVASANPNADVPLTTFEIDEPVSRQWTPNSWTVVESDKIPYKVIEQNEAYPNIYAKTMDVHFNEDKGTLNVAFNYQSGSNRLNIVGVDLLDASGSVVTANYHAGFTGTAKTRTNTPCQYLTRATTPCA